MPTGVALGDLAGSGLRRRRERPDQAGNERCRGEERHRTGEGEAGGPRQPAGHPRCETTGDEQRKRRKRGKEQPPLVRAQRGLAVRVDPGRSNQRRGQEDDPAGKACLAEQAAGGSTPQEPAKPARQRDETDDRPGDVEEGGKGDLPGATELAPEAQPPALEQLRYVWQAERALPPVNRREHDRPACGVAVELPVAPKPGRGDGKCGGARSDDPACGGQERLESGPSRAPRRPGRDKERSGDDDRQRARAGLRDERQAEADAREQRAFPTSARGPRATAPGWPTWRPSCHCSSRRRRKATRAGTRRRRPQRAQGTGAEARSRGRAGMFPGPGQAPPGSTRTAPRASPERRRARANLQGMCGRRSSAPGPSAANDISGLARRKDLSGVPPAPAAASAASAW